MIKWIFKWAIRLALLVVVLIVVLFLSKDAILRTVIEHRVRSETGMDARIGRVSYGILSPVLTIENFRLYNPPEFGGTPFLEVPELHIEWDPLALAKHELHMKLLRLNVKEIVVVRNENGQTNIAGIFNTVTTHAAKTGSETEKALKEFEFTGIDVFNLTLGKVRYIDLKDSRNNCETDLNCDNQVFKPIKSESDLTAVGIMVYLRTGGNLCFMRSTSAQDALETFKSLLKKKRAPE